MSATHQPLSLTQISEATGIDASSALRLLKVLASDYRVLRDDGSKLYAPGPRALFPLDLHHPLNTFRRSATHLMQGLAGATGLTTAIHVYLYGERIVLDVVPGSRPITPFYDTHVSRPPHVSAAGKLFLLSLDPAARQHALGPAPYPRLTERTLCDSASLATELAEAEARGYATSIGEAYPWLSSVAAPIRTRNGRIIGCFIAFGMADWLPAQSIPALGERIRQTGEIFAHSCPVMDAVERLVAYRSPRPGPARSRPSGR